MRTHTASELRFTGDIQGPDFVPRATGIRMGLDNLSGRRLEQAQLTAAETTHMLLVRQSDAAYLDTSCYIVLDSTTYVVDYLRDPLEPRPNMWLEVFCHVEKGDTAVVYTYAFDGGTF